MRRNISTRRTILLCRSPSPGRGRLQQQQQQQHRHVHDPAGSSSSPASAATVNTSSCGTKPGVKATGTPIPLGAIATNQPGTSFTDIPNMAKAYFNCVNANGGINGHPIKLYIATEQTNPAQIAADAKQLVQTDKVVGIVGNTSIIECSIEQQLLEEARLLRHRLRDRARVLLDPEQRRRQHGPAVQLGRGGAVRARPARLQGRLRPGQRARAPATSQPGLPRWPRPPNTPIVQLTENVPITDANSVAIKEVNDAGPNGAVILNFTPPQALVILQAAQKLGLEDRVKLWGCSTPCNTDFLAQSLGPKWNDKLFVNAELTPPDGTNTPTMNLYKAILKQYGSSVQGGIGSFSQMGFTEAEIAVHALQSITGRVHGAERQRRVQGGEGLQHRHAVPAVDVRRLPAAHPEQRRLHRHGEQRQDDHGPGLHADLGGRPADRAVPEGAAGTAANAAVTSS